MSKKLAALLVPKVYHPVGGGPPEEPIFASKAEIAFLKAHTDGTSTPTKFGIPSFENTYGHSTPAQQRESYSAPSRSQGPTGGFASAPARTAPSTSVNTKSESHGNPTGGSLQAPARTAPSVSFSGKGGSSNGTGANGSWTGGAGSKSTVGSFSDVSRETRDAAWNHVMGNTPATADRVTVASVPAIPSPVAAAPVKIASYADSPSLMAAQYSQYRTAPGAASIAANPNRDRLNGASPDSTDTASFSDQPESYGFNSRPGSFAGPKGTQAHLSNDAYAAGGGFTTPAGYGTDQYSVVNAANRVGINPKDLATVMNYETIGTMDPSIVGGKANRYQGLIQFGPAERERYNVSRNSTFDEQAQAAASYLQDRQVKPGMGVTDIYGAINVGTANPKLYGRSDGRGNIYDKVAEMKVPGGAMERANGWLGDVTQGYIPPSGSTQIASASPIAAALMAGLSKPQATPAAFNPLYGSQPIPQPTQQVADTSYYGDLRGPVTLAGFATPAVGEPPAPVPDQVAAIDPNVQKYVLDSTYGQAATELGNYIHPYVNPDNLPNQPVNYAPESHGRGAEGNGSTAAAPFATPAVVPPSVQQYLNNPLYSTVQNQISYVVDGQGKYWMIDPKTGQYTPVQTPMGVAA